MPVNRELPDWSKRAYADVLATRDIAGVFKVLKAHGWTQRAIGNELGWGNSQVSEIMHGRKVIMIDVFERIAKTFSIPPGKMGLAFTDDSPVAQPPAKSPDLVDYALKSMLGQDVEQAEYLTRPTQIYSKIGKSDAEVFNQYFLALQRIETEHSGQLVPAQALIQQLRRMLQADMPAAVRARLAPMEGWVNSFAGWCAIDRGLYNIGMTHFSRALEVAAKYDDDLGRCRALFSSGKAEMHYGDPEQALKLFQLAVVPAGRIGSKLYQAGLAAHSAWAVSQLRPEHVKRYVSTTWESYSLYKPEREYEGMDKFFNRPDILGVTGQAQVLSAPEKAIEDVSKALKGRKPGSRSAAFETATLAHAYLAAGYSDKAVSTGRTALKLVRDISSRRTAVRLAPLKLAAYEHGTRDLTDLAEDIRRVS
ncbi:helix-turn-helix domain-containing protein [Amycolatopsis sp. NPDC003731]